VVLEVVLVPETWIIAPAATREQLRRYAERGWISAEDAEHLDRAFPRDAEGRPVILKHWLLAPMKRAAQLLGLPRHALEFSIVDERGLPVEYVVVPGQPLRYRRIVLLPDRKSTEYFEYIDSTFELRFRVRTRYPREFAEALAAAGRIGLMARTGRGFGKFRVRIQLQQST